jgi:hypothetical protein
LGPALTDVCLPPESGPALAAAGIPAGTGGTVEEVEEDEDNAEVLAEEKCNWNEDSAVTPFCDFGEAPSNP